MRRGGLGIRNQRLVHGLAFLASNFVFGSAQEELLERFSVELRDSWKTIQADLNLNVSSLVNIDALGNIEPEYVDIA